MRTLHPFVWMIALAALASAPVALADDADETSGVIGGLAFVDEVEVTVVSIDVFVHDKAGRPITDLEAGDFRIFQDGAERTLSNFARYSEEVIAEQVAGLAEPAAPLPAPTATAVPDAVAPPPRPEIKPIYIVIFVDSENLRPFDRNRVLNQMRSFLTDIMYPHVHVMVVNYHRSLDVVVPFTTDKSDIMERVRSIFKVQTGRPEQDNQRTSLLRDLQRLREKGPFRGSGSAPREVLEMEARLISHADKVQNDMEFALNAVREVTTSMSGLPGRKWLVYVSNGIPMVPGRDLFHDFTDIYQAASQLTLLSRYDMSRWYETLTSTANAQGVSFMTIDASGLGGTSRVSAEYIRPVDPVTATIYLNNHQETLQYMADRTGGRAILNANDISDGLEAFRTDLFSYYSLGYTITATGSDIVHRIEVELPEHPEYRLSYRRSFVEKSLESRVQDAVLSGLMYELSSNPMGIGVAGGAALPATDDRWIVPLEVTVPLAAVALIPELDDYVGRVAVFVAARDARGRQSDLQRQEHEVRVPAADYERRRGEHVTVELKMLMVEGSHRVAVGVMDRITRQASYRTLVRDVPGTG